MSDCDHSFFPIKTRYGAVYECIECECEVTDELYQYITRLKARTEALEAERRWRTDLPANIDECMDIAVKLKVGWFRCIGYVLQDLEITDYDQNHVGYKWGEGCYWRHVSDPPENE